MVTSIVEVGLVTVADGEEVELGVVVSLIGEDVGV